jgi:hypothetical protein
VPSHTQRAISLSAWACGGDGTWQDGNVRNEKRGVTSAETKRNTDVMDMEKRALRWLNA